MLTEKECREALDGLRNLERYENLKKWNQVAPQVKADVIEQLIHEHFDDSQVKPKFKLGELVFNPKKNHIGIVAEILISKEGKESVIHYNVFVANKAFSFYELTKESDLVKQKKKEDL